MYTFPKPEISFFPSEKIGVDFLFSILIPSWNNLEMLKFCIQSIRENSTFNHQIVVHVNEGMDGTLEWIKEQKMDYSFSELNAGVCYSVNAMAKMAKTEFLLYLNDDMYVCKNWDQALWEQASRFDHKLWYLSGTMIERNKSTSICVISPHDFGKDPNNFMREELDSFASNLNWPDWFGASWPPSLMPLELFQKVGGYSEEFSPGMYSDPDFSMKLWQAGVREFRGIGASLVYHFMSKSTARVLKNNGRKQFAKKWGIPSSYFYSSVLNMGIPYSESARLTKMPFGISYLWAKIRALFISLK